MSTNMTTDERRKITALIEVIERFREHDRNMPTQTLLALLYCRVLEDEEGHATVRNVGIKLDTSKASASRNVLAYTSVNRHHEQGIGFLDTFENPEKRNEKIIRFIDKGKRFLDGVVSRLQAAF